MSGEAADLGQGALHGGSWQVDDASAAAVVAGGVEGRLGLRDRGRRREIGSFAPLYMGFDNVPHHCLNGKWPRPHPAASRGGKRSNFSVRSIVYYNSFKENDLPTITYSQPNLVLQETPSKAFHQSCI